MAVCVLATGANQLRHQLTIHVGDLGSRLMVVGGDAEQWRPCAQRRVCAPVTMCVKCLWDTYCRALLVLKHDLEPGLDGSWDDRREDDGHLDGAEGSNLTLCYLLGKQGP